MASRKGLLLDTGHISLSSSSVIEWWLVFGKSGYFECLMQIAMKGIGQIIKSFSLPGDQLLTLMREQRRLLSLGIM